MQTSEMLRLAEMGKRHREIASLAGLSRGAVTQRLNCAGVERVSRTSDKEKALIRSVYDDGATLTEIAEAGGPARSTARAWIVQAGGTLRAPGHRPGR